MEICKQAKFFRCKYVEVEAWGLFYSLTVADTALAKKIMAAFANSPKMNYRADGSCNGKIRRNSGDLAYILTP